MELVTTGTAQEGTPNISWQKKRLAYNSGKSKEIIDCKCLAFIGRAEHDKFKSSYPIVYAVLETRIFEDMTTISLPNPLRQNHRSGLSV